MLDCEWEKSLNNAPFDYIYGKHDASTQFYETFAKKLAFLTQEGLKMPSKLVSEYFS